MLVARKYVPWYDERFVGYRKNKVLACASSAVSAMPGACPAVWHVGRADPHVPLLQVVHLLHLARLGLRFVVHPRAFVVHSPHPRARAWQVTHKTGLWDQLAELYAEVKGGLEGGNYAPAARYACGEHLLGPMLGPAAAQQSSVLDTA